MKYCFLQIVLTVSYSVYVIGDIEIYPDFNFDLSSSQHSNIGNEYGVDPSYSRWPSNLNEYADKQNTISSQLGENEKLSKFLNSINLGIRPLFPLLRNNYAFDSSQDDDQKDMLLDRLDGLTKLPLDDISINQRVSLERNRNSNIKFVEHNDEFAYSPSDPRFYQDFKEDDFTSNFPKKNEDILNNKKPAIQTRNQETFLTDSGDDEIKSNFPVKVLALHENYTNESTGVYIIAIVAGISAAATVGLIAVGIGWYNLQKHVKNASDVEYPAYGITGPNKDSSPSTDKRLAQSAQMYHYQHQKQQIIAMQNKSGNSERHGSVSEIDTDEENEEGDYTVYECPGLAPTGEMEVKNPLFQDDITPSQISLKKSTDLDNKK